MQKKRKSIFTAVIAALFVLSVSYFALLAPTTAWYYEETVPDNYKYFFNFRNFNESVQQITASTVNLRAATRFADSEEYLFGEVCDYVDISTTNQADSDLTGIVRVEVTGGLENGQTVSLATGLRWYVISSDTALTTPTAPSYSSNSNSWSKGSNKDAIETMLVNFGVTPTAFSSESSYSTYNTKAITALNASNANGVLVEPNHTKYLRIVFWAEYGDLKSSIESSTLNESIINQTVQIKVTAEPYLGKYSTAHKTLRLSNSTGSLVTVDVLRAGETIATHYDVPTTGLSITIPADAQLRVTLPAANHATASSGVIVSGDNSNICSIAKMTNNETITIS